MSKQIKIEVVYGLPHHQSLLTVNVDEGADIETAINASGILQLYPKIDLANTKVGIWSKSKKLTEVVREHDRIEIYRALIADPKEVRKRRAEQAKEAGRADKVTGGRVDPQRK
jgi:putative ubiquitin-RnfH superfamily antitoxin RatB of RatAB toxin-antitoxin module